MKRKAYFQGTADPKEKRKPDKLPVSRKNLDVRSPKIYTWFTNYDYSDEDPSETSPGGGPYHGPMDKYKSVKDFLDKRRKKQKKKYEEGLKESNSESRLAAFTKLASEVKKND